MRKQKHYSQIITDTIEFQRYYKFDTPGIWFNKVYILPSVLFENLLRLINLQTVCCITKNNNRKISYEKYITTTNVERLKFEVLHFYKKCCLHNL